MEWRPYIISNAEIQTGKPVIKGTRLTVEFILGLFSKGWTQEQVLANYPQLTRDAINAVFAFAIESLHDESIYFLKQDVV
jgi:uncharacterized protein (DUF433 family)